MSRIIGCRDLHIAILTKDTVGAEPTWEEPTRVPSLINISISDTVESTKFYSDDQIEQTFSKTAGKEVEVELGHLSPEIESIITGKELVNGCLIQKGDDSSPEIALMFRAPLSRNGEFRYLTLFKGSLSRTESEYATQEDGVESSTVKLTGVFIPLASNGIMAATADSTVENAEITKTWFDEVKVPKKQVGDVKKK